MPTGRLFSNGVDQLHLSQGNLPDCSVLAVILGLSRNPYGARILEEMILPLANGDYHVTFPGEPRHPVIVRSEELKHDFVRHVEMNPQLPFPDLPPQSVQQRVQKGYDLGHSPGHATGERGARILEIAYARLQKQLDPGAYRRVADSNVLGVYKHPNYHYKIKEVLKTFLNRWVIEELNVPGPDQLPALERMLNIIAWGGPDCGLFLNTHSKGRGGQSTKHLEPSGMLKKWHYYHVARIDRENRTVLLRDPHNSRLGLEVPYEEIAEIGHYFTLIEPPRTLTGHSEYVLDVIHDRPPLNEEGPGEEEGV